MCTVKRKFVRVVSCRTEALWVMIQVTDAVAAPAAASADMNALPDEADITAVDVDQPQCMPASMMVCGVTETAEYSGWGGRFLFFFPSLPSLLSLRTPFSLSSDPLPYRGGQDVSRSNFFLKFYIAGKWHFLS